MRPVFFGLAVTLAGAAGLAQSTTNTFITDINGHTTEAQSIQASDQTKSERTKTERWQSINGRSVPLDQMEERVISDTPSGKVTERIVRKFSPTGGLASTEKTVIEEQKSAGGSSVRQTTWRTDVNGNLSEAERRTTETRGTGANKTSETVVSRPTLNGSFQSVEKRSAASSGTEANQKTDETVYRLSQNGEMVAALRQVTVATKDKSHSTAETAYYEPGITGTLQLASQSVSSTTTAADGSAVTEVNLYARSADGRVQEQGAPQQIKEQQIIERRKKADGSVVETLSVRRPSMSDSTKLGGVQQISETVCAGKCD